MVASVREAQLNYVAHLKIPSYNPSLVVALKSSKTSFPFEKQAAAVGDEAVVFHRVPS
jgi:hypothetical protein